MQVVYGHDPVEQEHTKDGHPENRFRLSGTLALLEETGALAEARCLPVRPLDDDELRRVHPTAHLNAVAQLTATGGGQLDADTYVTPRSDLAARAAAGSLVGIVDEILSGRAERGFSIMRPPGHHALRSQAMGFCIYANVALAARAALEVHGLERVLVVDWDVHHGNGTEAIFEDDPTVGFFSTHQYPYYPGTGALTDVGRGAGAGTTLNVPLPPGIGDRGYGRIFTEILAPFARRFEPQLILVSAGYDAHWRDPLAQEAISLAGFANLTRQVVALAEELCEGRVALALEGGYDLEVLPHAVLNSLRILGDAGAPISDPFGDAPAEKELPEDLIAEIRRLHSL